jgi:hypothetical protein
VRGVDVEDNLENTARFAMKDQSRPLQTQKFARIAPILAARCRSVSHLSESVTLNPEAVNISNANLFAAAKKGRVL